VFLPQTIGFTALMLVMTDKMLDPRLLIESLPAHALRAADMNMTEVDECMRIHLDIRFARCPKRKLDESSSISPISVVQKALNESHYFREE
jgi:hypothetical protein